MKKILLIFFIAFGLIGSSWALQVSPTAIVFACENTGLVVEEVQYLRDDGRLCGESYNRIPESKEEAESQAKEWEECPISIPVVNLIPYEDNRCIEAEKKISSGEVFKSKVITYQRVCEIIDGENTQKCPVLKSELLSNQDPFYVTLPVVFDYESFINSEPLIEPDVYTENKIHLIEVPVFKCGDLIVDTDKPHKPDNPEERWKFIDVLIDLEPDDPICIKAEIRQAQIESELTTHPPPPIYVVIPIEISVLKCDGLTVNMRFGEIPQTQIITYEDGKICSEYFKDERCYENTDEAIEIGETFVCSPYLESTDCYYLIEEYEFVEKNLEPDNPMCIEAEKNND